MQKLLSPRSLTEGALMAAITAIIALIGNFLPIISVFSFLIIAVPIIIVIIRNNLTTGVIASIVATFLVAVLMGPITAFFFYLQFMPLALAYGYMFKNEYSAGKILAIGTFVAVVSTILLMLFTMILGQMDFEQQKLALQETVDRTIALYEDYGLMDRFEEQGLSKADLHTMLTNVVNFFIRVLPALLIIGSVFTAATHFLMARVILKRFGHQVPHIPPFSQWHLPWYVVWGLIAGWAGYLIGDFYHQEVLRVLGQNILITYGVILFILGLSVLAFYFKKLKLSGLTRLLVIMTALLFLNGFIFMTIFIGMFDLVLDHRHLNRGIKEN